MTGKTMETARALVLEEFNKPYHLKEFPLPEPGAGEVLVRITAAGICGSDLHILAGSDPRIELPMIPGHEGVGEVAKVGDGAVLDDGSALEEGIPIVWERSLTCGKCYFCVRGERHLCVERQVYGINFKSDGPSALSGNFATHILLKKGTSIYLRDKSVDPAILVSATCSGATAAHAHEYTGIKGGETVVIYGSGPLAAFQIAFALDAGAKWVVVITRTPGLKADMATAFGADDVLFRLAMDSGAIKEYLDYQTGKTGVDVVIDTTPSPLIFREAVEILRRGGVYVNVGLAIPAKPIEIELYSDIVNKQLAIHGIWASDSNHLKKALSLVQSGKYPFDKLVTHRFPLEKHEEALQTLREKKGMKVVFEP